ncbi:helix-turn-helix domain-containing protein [Novosphingobium percolationis]|uniref:helix-turn-helix domain-containing protein n=1 Tax=Novosphingobium percolationis TaxID=2871811 RepID=UPI001CD44FBD
MENFELLTEAEVAKVLRISPRALRSARAAGELQHVKIGRLIRYRQEHVESFIRQATVQAPGRAARVPSVVRGRRQPVRTFTARNQGLAA